MKKLVSTILTVAVLCSFAFMALGSSSDSAKFEEDSNNNATTTTTAETIPEFDAPAVITYDNVSYSIAVEFFSSVPGDDYGIYALNSNLEYMSVGIHCLNSGSNDTFVSSFDFKCYADNVACEEGYIATDGVGSSVTVSPGREGECIFFFIVPKDAEDVELEFEPDWISGDRAIIHCK